MGELFVFGMMLTIMMQTVMIEKTLYRVPSKFGYFSQAEEKQDYFDDEYVKPDKVIAIN